jgi:AbrB family looped-hinge helix DNA binding protein
MDTVVISRSFQVRLPQHVRRSLGLTPGQLLRVVQRGGSVELVPVRPAFEARCLFSTDRGRS